MRNSMDFFRGTRLPVWKALSDFDDLFERTFQGPWTLTTETHPAARELIQPNIEVEETDHAYLISMDLPGIRKEDLQIDLNENSLIIAGERKREIAGKDTKPTGKQYGKFQRSFTLPNTIDGNKVEANLENGVLTITLAKSEAAKPRSIQINSGKSGFFSKLIGAEKDDAASAPTGG